MLTVYERSYAAVYLGASSGALATVLAGDELGDAGPLYSLSWAGLYMIGLAYLIFSRRAQDCRAAMLRLLLSPVGVVGCLPLLSSIWSATPTVTVLYGASVFFNCLFACYLASRCGVDECLKLVSDLLNFLIILSLFLVVIGYKPAFYIDPLDRGNLFGTALVKGLFSHKIYAAFYCCISILINFYTRTGTPRVVLCSLSFLLLAITGSALGAVAFSMMVGFCYFTTFFQKQEVRLVLLAPVIIFGGVLSLIISSNLESILLLLGRDPSMTGRAELWEWAEYFWAKRPLLGWGYASIFSDAPNAPGAIINDYAYYKAPHFHNAYRQALAELGLVGFLAYLWLLIRTSMASIDFFWKTKRRAFQIVGAFVLLVSATGSAMNIGLRYNELATVLVFYSGFVAAAGRNVSARV